MAELMRKSRGDFKAYLRMQPEMLHEIIAARCPSVDKGSLNNIFQDTFNKILSQQLTHDRFYISEPCYVKRRLNVSPYHIHVAPCKTSRDGYVINPFPNKPWFLRICSTRLLKTLTEKEKLLVTSNFSFFHSVFYPIGELSAIFIKVEILVCKLFQFGRVQNLSFRKDLIHVV